MIPEDWELSNIGKWTRWLSGGTPNRGNEAFWNGHIPWISGSTLKTFSISTSDQFITDDAVAVGSKMALTGAVLLLVRGSALHKEIRAGVVVSPVAFNQDVKALIPSPGLDSQFLAYYLLARECELLNLVSSAGNSAGVLDTVLVKNFTLLVPPLEEQRAIATALSDVDALITALDKLIAKKRAIKTAAMQQLLTGKARLPGFSGEWERKWLGYVAELRPGINKPVSNMGAGTLYVTVQDLYDGTSIRVEKLGRIKISSAELENQALKMGDIIFGKSSVKRDGIGYPNIFLGADEPVVCTGFAYRVRAIPNLADARYLFYVLRWEPTRRWLVDHSQASALTNINKAIADGIPVKLPPLEEQTAIAQVLSDMDAEIAALEARRDKTRAIKQGMMQQLLTGRVRLV